MATPTPAIARGATAPEKVLVIVTTGDSGQDLSRVTGAEIQVTAPGNRPMLWEASIIAQDSTTLRITHVFAKGEVEISGEYRLYVKLMVPDGVLRCRSFIMPVVDL
jgi:hypothetical protein